VKKAITKNVNKMRKYSYKTTYLKNIFSCDNNYVRVKIKKKIMQYVLNYCTAINRALV